MADALRLGSTKILKIRDEGGVRTLLPERVSESETVLVKPNFVDNAPGTYTDPEALRALFEALDTRIIVVEGHQLVRCLFQGETGLPFTVDGKEVDWQWLHRGGWGWVTRHPDWGWFRDGGHLRHMRKLDQRYMDEKGLSDLFSEFDAEYVNVTDEIWGGRVVDPGDVKRVVEERYPLIRETRIHGFMPRKLAEHRGCPLISFAKFKQYATFTLKNMFGLIPDPIRAWWHGPHDSRQHQSIMDINKLYRSFFDVVGVCEALRRTPVHDEDGTLGEPGFRYRVAEDLGLVGTGPDPVQLDSVLCALGRYPTNELDMFKAFDGVLGHYDDSLVEKARAASPEWFPG
ncbi:hypothetical protein A3K69_01860 [Candidatus Bathyarchaeota archaeon RBG_16_57_9]|nr:MAG: hypothetical protein A3K69_01860 [Candidatus Bathyarchaeota archaeon RBG_16_57_9]OGD53067.1 MAG: hypothetical protein A3K81_00655 [Candidatus Bathyarchaeota archaeon RBG_13_60_20]